MTNEEIIAKYCEFNDCAWIKQLSESERCDLRILMTSARQDQMDRVEQLITNA